tara:strand:- start:11178 stop:11516 length:339 start_codon:yes stop_codon:yes gene_type:complete
MKFVKIKEGFASPAGLVTTSFEVPSSQALFISHSVGLTGRSNPSCVIQGSINNSDFVSLPSSEILSGGGNITSDAGIENRTIAFPHMRILNGGGKELKFDIYAILDLEEEDE